MVLSHALSPFGLEQFFSTQETHAKRPACRRAFLHRGVGKYIDGNI